MVAVVASALREAPTGLGGLLRNIGPGVIVAGSVVGAGELLIAPRVGAELGFEMLWAVIFACIAKFFIQLELGRQCILHNRTTIQILDLVPGWRWRGTSWIVWVCIIGYFSVTLTLIGILGSVAGLMTVIFPALSQEAWAIVSYLLMCALLWRGVYQDLEMMIVAMVASFSLIVIGCVLMLGSTPYAITATDIASGVRFVLPQKGAFVALALMGAVGTTAVELFMYPYWIKEKGYPEFVGPRDDSAQWRERYRGWMRVLTTDALVCTSVALVITCAYYLLGASVLAHRNVIPEGMRVVEQVSLIFTETFGGWTYPIFMFGAFCTLFSSLLVCAAAAGRITTDFLRQVGVIDKRRDTANLIRYLQLVFPLLWLLFILFDMRTLDFILKGANANNIFLIPLAYGVLHLAMRAAPNERMSVVVEGALLLTIWAILSFTVINLSQVFAR